MRDPQPGSARDRVYREMRCFRSPVSAGQIKDALRGKVDPDHVDVAISTGVKQRDIVRFGDAKPYTYRLCARLHPDGAATTTLPVAKATPAREIPDNLAPSIGTVCGSSAMRAPENRSQGTIEEALRAVIPAGLSMTLDEIFLALPIGWSRREASSALQEGMLDGWLAFDGKGWSIAGEPPERKEDRTRIVDPLSHAQLRLQEIRGGINVLLRDTVRLHGTPGFIRHLAIAYEEIDQAFKAANDASAAFDKAFHQPQS